MDEGARYKLKLLTKLYFIYLNFYACGRFEDVLSLQGEMRKDPGFNDLMREEIDFLYVFELFKILSEYNIDISKSSKNSIRNLKNNLAILIGWWNRYHEGA